MTLVINKIVNSENYINNIIITAAPHKPMTSKCIDDGKSLDKLSTIICVTYYIMGDFQPCPPYV